MSSTGPCLDRLLEPRAIAVVGASANPGKVGHEVLAALSRVSVPLHPVHPATAKILGLPVVHEIDSLPQTVDLAVIATGADTAVTATEQCVARGIPFVVVLASGFSEIGADGEKREAKLRELAASGTTRILGPNTLGLQVPFSGVDTVFVDHATDSIAGGHVAFVSQSGSVAVEALLAAARYGFGLRAFIGLGNKADLTEMEFLEHFARDSETRCLALYMEDLSAGHEFLNRAREIALRKPVLAIKAGRTSAGAMAASSHTGRLSGSDRVIDGALAQHLIQRVDDDEALCDAAKALELCQVPAGNRVAVLSPAGGYGVMLTDLVETDGPRVHLEMAKLGDDTVEVLKKNLPGFASPRNPVDLTASADDDTFAVALEAVLADPGVDIVACVFFLAPPGFTDSLTQRLVGIVRAAAKPVVVLAGDEDGTGSVLRELHLSGVAAYPSVARTGTALRALEARRCVVERANHPGGTAAGRAESRGPNSAMRPLPNGPVNEMEAKEFLSQYGIPFAPSTLVPAEKAAAEGAMEPPSRGPFAVKVCSAEVLHKTEAGGVMLGVSAQELAGAVHLMRDRFPGADVLVEEMVAHRGVELICGAFLDPELGPCVMVGAGGVLAEIQQDVAFRLLPCTQFDANEMIDELVIAPVFDGYRNLSCSREHLVDIVMAVSCVVRDLGERFRELDLNPLVCTDEGLVALDAMVVTG